MISIRIGINSRRHRHYSTVPGASASQSLQLLLILWVAASTIDAVTNTIVVILLCFLLLLLLVLDNPRVSLAMPFSSRCRDLRRNSCCGGTGALLVVATTIQVDSRKCYDLLEQVVVVVLVDLGAGVSCEPGEARTV